MTRALTLPALCQTAAAADALTGTLSDDVAGETVHVHGHNTEDIALPYLLALLRGVLHDKRARTVTFHGLDRERERTLKSAAVTLGLEGRVTFPIAGAPTWHAGMYALPVDLYSATDAAREIAAAGAAVFVDAEPAAYRDLGPRAAAFLLERAKKGTGRSVRLEGYPVLPAGGHGNREDMFSRAQVEHAIEQHRAQALRDAADSARIFDGPLTEWLEHRATLEQFGLTARA